MLCYVINIYMKYRGFFTIDLWHTLDYFEYMYNSFQTSSIVQAASVVLHFVGFIKQLYPQSFVILNSKPKTSNCTKAVNSINKFTRNLSLGVGGRRKKCVPIYVYTSPLIKSRLFFRLDLVFGFFVENSHYAAGSW